MARRIDFHSDDPWGGGSPEPVGGPTPRPPVPQPSAGGYLLGLLSRPVPTVVRARGRRYWGPAALLAFVAGFLLLRSSDPGYDLTIVPFSILVGLMLTYPATALMRRICGAPDGITDATASQLVLVAGVLVLPAALSTMTTLGPGVTGLLLLAAAVVGFVLAVVIVAAAFGAHPLLGLLGCLVVLVVAAVLLLGAGLLVHVMTDDHGGPTSSDTYE